MMVDDTKRLSDGAAWEEKADGDAVARPVFVEQWRGIAALEEIELERRRGEVKPSDPPKPLAADNLPAEEWSTRLAAWHAANAPRVPKTRPERPPIARKPNLVERAIVSRGVPEKTECIATLEGPFYLTHPMKVILTALFKRQAAMEKKTEGRSGRIAMVIVLCGDPGAGKTAALQKIVAHWKESAEYVIAHAIGAVPESAWGEDRGMWARLRACRLVAIDEAGWSASPSTNKRIGELIFDIYNAGGIVLLGSNGRPEDFIAQYFQEDGKPLAIRGRLRDEQKGQHDIGAMHNVESVNYRALGMNGVRTVSVSSLKDLWP